MLLLLGSAAAWALIVLFIALAFLYEGMVVKLVQDVQDGRRDHSVADLIRAVEPVFWPLVGASILAGIGIGIGFILLIIPGLILLVIWAVVAPVIVIERPGVFAAFGRSRELITDWIDHRLGRAAAQRSRRAHGGPAVDTWRALIHP